MTRRVAREALDAAPATPTCAASGSRTSGRPWSCGTGRRWSRCTGPSSGRTAAPPPCAGSCVTRATRRRCAGARAWSLDPYFSGTKITWLLREHPDLRARAEAGELAAGTDRRLARRAAHRRRRARHRPDQRVAHAPHGPGGRGAGTRGCWTSWRCRPRCFPRSDQLRGDFGIGRRAPTWGSSVPIAGRGRRPAGGPLRAGMLGAPGSRRTPTAPGPSCSSTRARAGRLGARAPHHGRLRRRGGLGLRPGGVDLHRRGGHPVAPRRAGDPRAAPRSRRRWRARWTDNDGVYFVPAFVGLGAPHWEPDARGTLVGLTRGTARAHLVRAALESMAYATAEVLRAMEADSGVGRTRAARGRRRRAQRLAHAVPGGLLGIPVRRPALVETTALGAAGLAGIARGVWPSADGVPRGAVRRGAASRRRWRPRRAKAALGSGAGRCARPWPGRATRPIERRGWEAAEPPSGGGEKPPSGSGTYRREASGVFPTGREGGPGLDSER